MFESQKVVCTTHLCNPKKGEKGYDVETNARNRDRRAAEGTQKREARLARERVRDGAHRALRSAAQQERVLGYRRGRLVSEATDQRTSRFQQMSLAQQMRLTP